jgi:branched-chain amino acid transport system permease protein
MADVLTYTILGLVIGSAYAIAASGLVITYATSSVFNMAHGAVGMVMAFLYWELSVNRGLPTWLALFLVVGVVAPLFGALLERVAMRRLVGASVTVTLTVTVGVLVALFGAAQLIWPQAGRSVPPFLADRSFQVGAVVVDGHQTVTFLLALAVAGGLYLLLNRTRTGVAPCARWWTTVPCSPCTAPVRSCSPPCPGPSVQRSRRWPASCWCGRSGSATSS